MFGVWAQPMNNKGEDTSKIFVTSKEKRIFSQKNIVFFSNKRIDCFQKLCPANTSHNCHFETHVFRYTIHKLQLYAFEKVVVGTMSIEILLCRSNL